MFRVNLPVAVVFISLLLSPVFSDAASEKKSNKLSGVTYYQDGPEGDYDVRHYGSRKDSGSRLALHNAGSYHHKKSGSRFDTGHILFPEYNFSKADITGSVNFGYVYANNKDGFAADRKSSRFDTRYSLGGDLELFLGPSTKFGAAVSMKSHKGKTGNMPLNITDIYTTDVGGGLSLYDAYANWQDASNNRVALTMGPVGVSAGGSYNSHQILGNMYLASAEKILGNDIGSAPSFDNDWGYSEYIRGNKVVVPVDIYHYAEASIYFDSFFGRVEAGKIKGPEEKMRIDADTIAKGTGGLGGNWREHADLKGDMHTLDMTGRTSPGVQFLTNPGLYTSHKGIRMAKIAYYTPTIKGVSAGFAYAFDHDAAQDFSNLGNIIATNYNNGYKKGYFAAMNYTRAYDNNWKLRMSLGGEYGKHKDVCAPVDSRADECGNNHFKVKAWNAGAVIDNGRYGFATSYGNLGRSGLQKDLRSEYDYDRNDSSNTRHFNSPSLTPRGVPSENILRKAYRSTPYRTNLLAVSAGKSPPPDSSFGHAYVDNYSANYENPSKIQDTYYATLGTYYNIGPVGFSISALRSKTMQEDRAGGRADLEAVVYALEYDMTRGVKLYVEGAYFGTEDLTYAAGSSVSAIDYVPTGNILAPLSEVKDTVSDPKDVREVLVFSGVVHTDTMYVPDATNTRHIGAAEIRPGELYNFSRLPDNNTGFVFLVGTKIVF